MSLNPSWRWAGLLLLALSMLVVGAYWALGFWLTSAGGRQAVERALAERAGVPVRLDGAFDITLLPVIGVAGTELAVGPAAEILRSEEYAISLALRPLFAKRLVIHSIRLAGGSADLSQWPSSPGVTGTGTTDGQAPPVLPEIHRLTIRDFELKTGPGKTVHVNSFTLNGFAAGAVSAFALDVEAIAKLDGTLLWTPRASVLDIETGLRGSWPGTLRGTAELRLVDQAGSLNLQWSADADDRQSPADAHLALHWAWVAPVFSLQDIFFESLGQVVRGSGCVRDSATPELHLELFSERLDLDSLAGLAGSQEQGSAWQWAPGEEPQLPLELFVAIRVEQLLAAGAVADGVNLRVGGKPDCGDAAAETGG